MVPPRGIGPRTDPYHGSVIPLNYGGALSIIPIYSNISTNKS